jgi:hypothetical protein
MAESVAYQAKSSILYLARDVGVAFVGRTVGLTLPTAYQIFGESTIATTDRLVTRPIRYLRDYLSAQLPAINVTYTHSINSTLDPTVNYTKTCLIGLTEEFAFRGLIQSVLLRDVPKYIIKKIAPEKAGLVDHQVSVAARIVFTSLLFALAHGRLIGKCSSLLPQFLSGVVYSYQRERGASLLKLSYHHFVFDAYVFTVIGGFHKAACKNDL